MNKAVVTNSRIEHRIQDTVDREPTPRILSPVFWLLPAFFSVLLSLVPTLCAGQRTVPMVVEVTTAEELATAVQDAVPGDVIRLKNDVANGGTIQVNSSDLTLAQADDDAYVLTANIVVNAAAKLTLRNLILNAAATSSPIVHAKAQAEVAIFGCRFRGHSAGIGVKVVVSGKYSTIEGSDFIGLDTGISLLKSGSTALGPSPASQSQSSVRWCYLQCCYSPIVVSETPAVIENCFIADTGYPFGDDPAFKDAQNQDKDPFDSSVLDLDAGSAFVDVLHNTIWNSGGMGIKCRGGDIEIKSNILATGEDFGLYAETQQAGDSVVDDYNDVIDFRPNYDPYIDKGTHTIQSLPRFIGGDDPQPGASGEYADGDFRLRTTSPVSPCIGTGAGGSDMGRFGPMPPEGNFQAQNAGSAFLELDFFPKSWSSPNRTLVLNWDQPGDYAQGTPSGYQYSLDGGAFQDVNPVTARTVSVAMGTGPDDDGPHVVGIRAFRGASRFLGQPVYFIFAKHDPPTMTAPPDMTGVEQTTTAGTPRSAVALGSPQVSEYPVAELTVTNNALDVFPLGNTTVTWTLSDGTNTRTDTQTVAVVDTTPPEIVLQGNNPSTLECGTQYAEPGYTATDICAGNLTSSVAVTGSVNHNAVGSYTLHYNVSDPSQNPAQERTRTVNVVDTTRPVIALAGNNPMTLEWPTPYVEPGYTATDVCAGDLTNAVAVTGSVNNNAVGAYTLHYNVSDPSGNPAEENTRTVNVVDTAPPAITLSGGNVALEVGTAYVEPGYTATDNYDGEITSSVTVSGEVNPTVPDTYVLSYNVSDSSGNPAEETTRTVFVIEKPALLAVQISGGDSVSLTWSDLGPDFAYTVEFRDSLMDGNWMPVPPAEQWPTTATNWSDVSAASIGTRFYRVSVTAMP
ncbi:MAG: DUF5011 domain-containing protein [bacterium]|nr:DUF5011 domain-containing protein [bacterium]